MKFNKTDDGLFQCPECGRCYSKYGIHSHYFLQHTKQGSEFKNSGRYGTTGKRSWNSGLTKETDSRVLKGSNTLKNKYASGEVTSATLGKKVSEDTKFKIAQKLIGNTNFRSHKCGIGCNGYYKGFLCNSTYELVWVIYNLDHHIEFKRSDLKIPYIYRDKQHLYHPDFELCDGTIVEIKGFHNTLVDIKKQAIESLGYNYIILYKKDLKYCFDYVFEKYGKTQYNVKELYEDYQGPKLKYTCLECGRPFKWQNKYNLCRSCYNKSLRSHIPDKQVLYTDITTMTKQQIVDKYNTCWETIKNWLKFYDLPYLIRDICKLKRGLS